MNKYEELQADHQQLLKQREESSDPSAMLRQAQAYIEQVKVGAQEVGAMRDRSQLRANLRFWAAFVYEQTKTYPDTTLRPYSGPTGPETDLPTGEAGEADSAQPSGAQESGASDQGKKEAYVEPKTDPGQAAAPRSRHPISMIAGIAIVGGVILLIALFIWPQLFPGNPPVVNTKMPSPSSTAAGVKASSTPAPSPTRSAVARPSSTPGSGDGLDILVFKSQVITDPPEKQCSLNQYTLSLDFTSAMKPVLAAINSSRAIHLDPIRVLVSRAGTGEVAASADVQWNEVARPLTIQRPVETETLLVQVDQIGQPLMVFETVIVQFQANCQRSRVTIKYAPESNVTPKMISDFLAAASQRPPSGVVTLEWRLATWGPSPFDGEWVAEIFLLTLGGDGRFIYWVDDRKTGPQRLLENKLVLQEANCQPAYAQVGVTSNGQSTMRPLLLHAPVCP